MTVSEMAQRILEWYAASIRQMPWRGSTDPYAVWVSEIMLQQTRVDTVIPYFERWMKRFPDIHSLACAPLTDVLQVWEGLGYYSRARNLHRATWIVENQYGGNLPANINLLRKIPGIGSYTAAAIGSIAFGLDAAAVDGNIRRVLARVFNIEIPEDSPEGKRRFDQLAADNLPPGQAGDYNQAMMDLGATICLPKNPACAACPLNTICQAFQAGVQAERPVNPPKPPIPHYIVVAAVIRHGDKVLITLRPEDGLLGGMWEFPGGKQEPGETLPETLKREITEELDVAIDVIEPFGVYKHAYTHFKVTLHAFFCTLAGGTMQPLQVQEFRWVTAVELTNFPMGKLDRLISTRLQGRQDLSLPS